MTATAAVRPPRVGDAPDIELGGTSINPAVFDPGNAASLLAQAYLPVGTLRQVRTCLTGPMDNRPATHLTAPDGSWAAIAHEPGPDGEHDAYQGGPTRLLLALTKGWQDSAGLNHPPLAEFGITVHPHALMLWHRSPDGTTWPIPTDGGPPGTEPDHK